MTRRYAVAVLGGTFDRLHAGHRALLNAAFARADVVRIGLTTDRFVRAHPKPARTRVEAYRRRRERLTRFLMSRYPVDRWSIVALRDPWGGSVEPGVDLLVVSEETQRAVPPLNAERRRRGLPPLRVHVVPRVRGADGRPIASRRIRLGEIDAEGRRRMPLRVLLSGVPSTWTPAVLTGIRLAFPSVSSIRVRRASSAARRRLRRELLLGRRDRGGRQHPPAVDYLVAGRRDLSRKRDRSVRSPSWTITVTSGEGTRRSGRRFRLRRVSAARVPLAHRLRELFRPRTAPARTRQSEGAPT